MTNTKPTSTHKPTAEEAVAETARLAVDAVNPGASHETEVSAEPEAAEYHLDPQMVQQATQNKNARLIAMMVNENAMLEVALEQERRAHAEARAKLQALQQVLGQMGAGAA